MVRWARGGRHAQRGRLTHEAPVCQGEREEAESERGEAG